ncbi:MAG: hypothetical protein U0556_10420 [Dehalococcoidia bacterium]
MSDPAPTGQAPTSFAEPVAPNAPDRFADVRRAVIVFLLLWSVYAVTASVRFHSDDEMSVWAVAASLVGRGETTIDQIAWNQDLGGGVGRAMEDGRVYSKYGIGGSLAVAPLVALGALIPWAGTVGLATLLNGPVTAATGALLFLIGRRLSFGPAASALAALGYGLATLAWVYARYLFGEPLVALGWTAAFWLLLRPAPVGTLAAGIAAGAAILVRTASAVSVPLFLPLVWRSPWRVLLFLLPNVVALAAVGVFNALRFGSPFDSGYNPIESFSAPLGEGLWGLMFSPGRGLVWYAPPVLLAVAGAPLLLRRQREAALTALLIVVATILLYAKWHAWHGGWGWGPRLILPATPFLMVLALPIFAAATERATGGRRAVAWLARLAVGGLLFAGMAVSALGVLVDFNRPLLALLSEHPEMGAGVLFLTLNDIEASPIPAHLRLLLVAPPDLVWASGGLHLVLAVVSALALLTALRLVAVGWNGGAGWEALAVFAALATGAVTLAGTHMAYAAGSYSAAGQEIAAAVERLREEARPGDRLLVVGVGEAEPLLNRLPPWLPATQVLPEAEPISPLAEARTTRAAGGNRVWLLQRAAQPVGEDNGLEARLDSLAYKAATQRLGEVTLTRYAVSPAPALAPVSIDFGDRLRLTGWAARTEEDTVLVDLQWLALRSPGARYVVSLRLADASGPLLQRDREPTDGARPTDGWRAGETVSERLGLVLPEGLPSGRYRLQLVVYPVGGRPLAVAGGETATVGDVVVPPRP